MSLTVQGSTLFNMATLTKKYNVIKTTNDPKSLTVTSHSFIDWLSAKHFNLFAILTTLILLGNKNTNKQNPTREKKNM